MLKIVKGNKKVNVLGCTVEIFLPTFDSIVNLLLFLTSVGSNVGIHLFEHITTSAVERGLRDHSKPFHYEDFPFGK